MRKVTKKIVSESIMRLYDYGFDLSESQFLFLMLNSEELRGNWGKLGDVDAAFVVAILNAITKDCNVRSYSGFWPRGIISKMKKQHYFEELKNNAIKNGYILNANFPSEKTRLQHAWPNGVE